MASVAIQADIREAVRTFRFNELEVRELLRGPTGAVVRDLVRRGFRVEAQAKINASQPPRGGVPDAGSEPGHGPAVRTGRLRGSITHRIGADAISPYVDVGSAVVYAPYVELGTRYMAARPFLRPALEAARI